MKTLVRFLKPHKGLVALTLLILLIDNAGTLLVGDAVGETMFYGAGAGSFPTASAVVGARRDVHGKCVGVRARRTR